MASILRVINNRVAIQETTPWAQPIKGISQVVIGGREYTIYCSLESADAYNGFSAVWVAASQEARARALVYATRLLDRMAWSGVAVGPPLAWPRVGATCDGVAVPSTSVPEEICQATAELALAAINDPTLVTSPGGAAPVKSVTAGSASVTFVDSNRSGVFARGSGLPSNVEALIRCLRAPSGIGGGVSTGTDVESEFDRDDRYTYTEPIR